MAQKGVINELVNDKVFTDEERLLAGLKALNDEFNVSIRNAKLFSDSLAGAKSLKQLNADSAKAAQELEKLNKLMAQTVTAQERAATATIRRQQAEAKANAQTEKQSQSAKKASEAYEILNAAYREATALARNVGVQFGETSTQFQNAAKSANFLRERLDAIDKPLGNYQRNVGNYKSGFDGLGHSFQQLSREVPAFAVSFQTGILALSNNLPIFFDQIKATQQEINSLRAQGEKVPGVLARLGQSLVSPIGLLTIGVSVFTLFSKEIGEFIKAAFKGTEALDVFAEKQKALNEAFKSSEYQTAISNVSQLRSEINLAKEGFIDKDGVVKHYNETIGKTTGLVSSLDEAEKGLNNNAEAYIQFTLAKAAANIALQEAAKAAYEAELDRLKNEEDIRKFATKPKNNNKDAQAADLYLTLSLQKENENIKKEGEKNVKTFKDIADGFYKTAADLAKKNKFNFFDDNKTGAGKQSNTYAQYLQQQREVLDGVLQAEKASYEDRLLAIDAYEQASKYLIDNGVKAKEFTQIEANTKILDVTNDANKERIKVQSDAEKELFENEKLALDLRITQVEGYIEEEKRLREENIASLSDASAEELLAIQDRANNSLIINEEAYAKGEIGKAEYEKNKLDIEHEAAVASINEQIRLANVLLDIQDKAGLDTKSQRKALSDFKRKLDKEDADYEIAQIKMVGEARKRINDEIKNLKDEVFKLGVTLVNASYENEKNQIQERKDALTEETQREVDAVNRSIGTQQEKADKIAIIQAKAKAQQDVLDLRKREVAQRQAKFEKAVALSSVIQNTYAGAARALKDYPFPFSSIIAGLVIATGLASAANIIATPIPKYAKGTDYHKGGAMIVGDAGTELVIEPNGRQYLTPDTDTYTTAPTGTKVIPHHEVIKMLAKPDAVQYVGGQSIDIQALVAAQKQTTKAIQSQKMMGTLVTKKGWARQQARVSGWNSHKRNYLN